jgi:hypothetical protein
VYNVEEYKSQNKIVELFSYFLDGSYDTEDVLFYLYSRFVLYKEAGIQYTDIASQVSTN